MLALSLFMISPSWADAPAKTPEMLAKGKTAYAANCLTCHGDKGDGMGPAGKYMSPKPRNFTKDKFSKAKKANAPTAQEVFNSITSGLDGTAMVSFKSLPETDRWALAYYVLSFKK